MQTEHQHTTDDLLAAVRCADRQVERIRTLLAEINGVVAPAEWNAARQNLRSTEAALAELEQQAKHWGARG
jgi:hypothetical protein